MPECAACSHPSREEMERRVAAGHSMKAVARDFGLSYFQVRNHINHHAKAELKRYMADRAEPVVEQVRRLVERAERTLDGVESSGDDVKGKQLAGMYREVRSALELLGKMTGEFQTASVRRLLEKCGVKDEDELVRMAEERNALADMTLDDYFKDGCMMVRFCIEQRPELAEAAYREAFPKLLPKSMAVEVTDASVAEEVEG